MKSLLALVPLIPLVTACANHVRFVDVKDTGSARSVAESRIIIEPRAEVLDVERVTLRFSREDRIDARGRTTVTKVDEFTPYSVAHELYEVPVGAASIPLSVVLRIVDGVLGWVPDELLDGYTYWTFAALNPFMNAESESRVAHREVAKLRKLGESREELVTTPLRDAEVDVQLDDHAPVRLRTDSTGSIRIDLLELVSAVDAPARTLTIAITPGGDARSPVSQRMYIGRELSEQLTAASPHLHKLEQASASASALAESVQMLDRLGFRAQSLRLEEEVRARLTSRPQDLAKFRDALAEFLDGKEHRHGPTCDNWRDAHDLARRRLPASAATCANDRLRALVPRVGR